MKIEIITREQIDGTSVDYVLLINDDGSYTSMLKSTYEAMQAAQANYSTLSATIESTQPDEADLTEGTN